jgi:hypothetical protein
MKLDRLNPAGVATHTLAVIASEARQSSAVLGQSGLLRFARNDGVGQSGLPSRCAPRNDGKRGVRT